MSKLEVVCQVPDEAKHGDDGESVVVVGDKVFSCGDDGKVKFTKPKHLTPPQADELEAVIVHGQTILTSSLTGSVQVFDHDLKLLHDLKAHDYAVYDLLVIGDTLFTISVDCTVKTWDINTFQLKNTITGHEEPPRKICTNGKSVFIGDENAEVRVYSPNGDYETKYGIVEEVWGLHVEGNTLFTVRDRGITVTEVRGEENKFAVKASLEGRSPIFLHGDYFVCTSVGAKSLIVREKQPPSYKFLGEMEGHELIVTALGGWGHYLVSTAWDAQVKLWDLSTRKHVATCSVPACANSLAATDDGSSVFAVGVGGFICKMKTS